MSSLTDILIFNDKKVKYNKSISIINGPVHIKCAGSFLAVSVRPADDRELDKPSAAIRAIYAHRSAQASS